ncbi:hypothetical protein K439DRAFT_1614329 [Ramaria rubella]|nr:hypothetical protein K439DRAFT_1614329 [Ramaria rubella]
MHSFVLIALASSAFAVPVHNVVNAPVNAYGKAIANVDAPVNAVAPVWGGVAAAAKAYVPVKANVANVGASYVNAANGVGSNNNVHARGNVVYIPGDIDSLVKSVVAAVAKIDADGDLAIAIGNVVLNYIEYGGNGLSGVDVQIHGVNVPINVDAIVKAVVGVCIDLYPSISVQIGNVVLNYLNALNNVGSGNTVNARR